MANGIIHHHYLISYDAPEINYEGGHDFRQELIDFIMNEEDKSNEATKGTNFETHIASTIRFQSYQNIEAWQGRFIEFGVDDFRYEMVDITVHLGHPQVIRNLQ